METGGVQRLQDESYDVEVFADGNEFRIYIRTVAYLRQEALKAAEEACRAAMIRGDGEYCIRYSGLSTGPDYEGGLSKGPGAQEEALQVAKIMRGPGPRGYSSGIGEQAKPAHGLPKVPGVVLDKFAGGSRSDKGNPKVTETG